MRPFSLARPATEDAAIAAAAESGGRFVAGGTNLLDLMRAGVEAPEHLVDVGALPLAAVEAIGGDAGVRIGALARLADVAAAPIVRDRLPAIAEALLAGASPQLRNAATVGGNLLQRTRCPYFTGPGFACNKRRPGSGCDAIPGDHRGHAILGTSQHCIAVHPSDLAVALVALDARVHTHGPRGRRVIPIGDLHLEPGATPDRETVLQPAELIVEVVVPATRLAARSCYLKVRERASFAFATASAAAALEVRDGVVAAASIALGGVATRPWRCREAEAALVGGQPTAPAFAWAAEAALAGARPLPANAFKVELARRVVARALASAHAEAAG
jgi:xanthine dehydrogenase YagS FAD-binding subunit